MDVTEAKRFALSAAGFFLATFFFEVCLNFISGKPVLEAAASDFPLLAIPIVLLARKVHSRTKTFLGVLIWPAVIVALAFFLFPFSVLTGYPAPLSSEPKFPLALGGLVFGTAFVFLAFWIRETAVVTEVAEFLLSEARKKSE
jgi:hypothetical protein